MCNIPCELCADSEDCDLYFDQLKILEKLNKSEKTNINCTDEDLIDLD